MGGATMRAVILRRRIAMRAVPGVGGGRLWGATMRAVVLRWRIAVRAVPGVGGPSPRLGGERVAPSTVLRAGSGRVRGATMRAMVLRRRCAMFAVLHRGVAFVPGSRVRGAPMLGMLLRWRCRMFGVFAARSRSLMIHLGVIRVRPLTPGPSPRRRGEGGLMVLMPPAHLDPLRARLAIRGVTLLRDARLAPAGDEQNQNDEPTLQIRALRNRSAFAITETELKLIAAAAIIGLSRTPNSG